MRAIPIIIGAIVVLAGALVWLLIQSMPPGESEDAGEAIAIDSGARIEIEMLRTQIQGLQDQLASLQLELQSVADAAGAGRDGVPQDPFDVAAPVYKPGGNTIADQYANLVLIADRRNVNQGKTVATPSFLEEFLGRPREVLSDNCEEMTNPTLKAALVTGDVGPIRVQMLQPAVESLTRVFEAVQSADPDLYSVITTAGSLCVRQIRGTIGRTSTHSFGLAVDLNIDGRLDNLADGKTQLGLTILADFFREEGWVWGAGYGREDSMHFEVSRQQLEAWRAEGKI